MKFHIGLAAFLTLGLISESAGAQSVRILKEELSAAVLDAVSCAGATNWSGWVPVPYHRSVAWEIFFNGDAAPATTGVTMRCESSDANTTANDSGFDVHKLQDSATAGTSDSYVHTWNNAVTADERWTWGVDNLRHNYINCLYTCTAGDANDVLTVRHKRITP